jgi:hypothetical protein
MKDLTIFGEHYLGTENPYGAPEVQRIEGDYKNCEFELDRIYQNPYVGADGETYYESYYWEYYVEATDRYEQRVDKQIILDLYDQHDYDLDKESSNY